MTLQPRVIPAIQIKDGKQVKTTRFKQARYVGSPANTAKIFSDKGAHELALISISGKQFDVLKAVSRNCFIPLSYGGGIDSVEAAMEALSRGADKVILNTHWEIAEEIADEMGKQSVVISIDFDGFTNTYVNHGTEPTGMEIVTHAKEAGKVAGEIILNSMDRDGTLEGYDWEALKLVKDSVASMPMIALGGAKCIEEMKAANTLGYAAAAGSMFCYRKGKQGVLVNYPAGLSYCNRDGGN